MAVSYDWFEWQGLSINRSIYTYVYIYIYIRILFLFDVYNMFCTKYSLTIHALFIYQLCIGVQVMFLSQRVTTSFELILQARHLKR